MGEFENTLEDWKFRSTNAAWNDLRLNDPWSVGYVTTLIELKPFERKEDWESLYYNSGEYRNKIIAEQYQDVIDVLNDPLLTLTDPKRIEKLDLEVKNINYQHGRTKEQMTEKGRILHKHMVAKGKELSVEECTECVRYRTICETWNGVIVRERNTVKGLEEKFRGIEFKKTQGEFDYKYAVDYELYKHGNLRCGIQIKPKSYLFSRGYILKARSANSKKNALYKQEFDKNVYDIIAKGNGTVENVEVLEKLQNELN